MTEMQLVARSPRVFWMRWLERDNVITLAAIAVLMQTFATILFLIDAILDVTLTMQWLHNLYHRIEMLNALALVMGVLLGLLVVAKLIYDARRRETMVTLAKGGLAEVIDQRFAEWGLTAAEGEVALFSLKGLDIAEIARMRESAPGTVRAQLSRVYDKAGVTSQASLMAMVVDEFLDVAPALNARLTRRKAA